MNYEKDFGENMVALIYFETFKVQNLQSPLEHCSTDFQGHQNFAEKLNPKIALQLKCSINVNHHYQSSTLMQSAQIVQFVLSLKIIVKYPKLFSFQRKLKIKE